MGIAIKSRHTDWESVLYGQIIAAGLPAPERRVVGIIPGRKYEFDLWYKDELVAVEIQGGIYARGKMGHHSATGINRDCEKIVLAQLCGVLIIPVTSDHIKAGKALDWIERAMKHRTGIKKLNENLRMGVRHGL